MHERRVLAVDLGGTKTAVGVVDSEGRIVARETAPTPLSSFAASLDLIVSLCHLVLSRAGPVEGLGLALPGIVDRQKGILLRSPSSGWTDAPFGEAVAEALGLPARCDNDVNACALAEALFGAGRGLSSFFWMTVSTGIGGAVCIDGSVFPGSRGMAGEVGHLVVADGGALCGCGNRGCLEAEAAGPAWRRKALAHLDAGVYSAGYLGGLPREEVEARTIADGARRSDPLCLEVLRDVGSALARGVAAISNIFDPEAVILGGGIASAFDLLTPHIERGAAALSFQTLGPQQKLLPSALGRDAALIGAAALVLHHDRQGESP
jgi:glucokinase